MWVVSRGTNRKLFFLCLLLSVSVLVLHAQKSGVPVSDTVHRNSGKSFLLNGDTILSEVKQNVLYRECLVHLMALKEVITPLSNKGDTQQLQRMLVRLHLPDTSISHFWQSSKIIFPVKRSRLLTFGGGYINYNYSFRTAPDSIFAPSGVAQHLFLAGGMFTLAEKIPLQVSYTGRESNSEYFKSYRNFKVDFDVEQYRRLKAQKDVDYFRKKSLELQNPLLPFALQAAGQRIQEYNRLLQDPVVVKKLIAAKEILLQTTFPDTAAVYADSLKREGASFIQAYDSLLVNKEKYRAFRDSLLMVKAEADTKVKQVEQIVRSKGISAQQLDQLVAIYGKNDEHIRALQRSFDGLRSLSLGRTYPNYGPLTVQNLNVRGVSFEYVKNKLYLSASAGMVDFHFQEYLYQKQKVLPQYIAASRVGYVDQKQNKLLLTYYKGEKQITGGNLQGLMPVTGLAFTAQIAVAKQTIVTGEVAQSAVPEQSTNGEGKRSLNFSDGKQRAYSFGLKSYLPKISTRIEGFYRSTGINFQAFNGFQYNAAFSGFSVRMEQPLFKRQLQLTAAVQRNDFYNPFVPQRYNANTVYKNALLTLRKARWPVITVGLSPSTQMTMIAGAVFESHFQTFTGHVFHQYRIGEAKSQTILLFNHFYNEIADSSLPYFNAQNVLWRQSFDFGTYVTTVGASYLSNTQYRLLALETGFSSTLFRHCNLDVALKVNNLNNTIVKVGFRSGGRLMLSHLGTITFNIDKNFIPGSQNQLSSYETYQVGFTKSFY